MKSAWWALTFAVGLMGAGMRTGVAPWNFPDLPNPDAETLGTGPRVGDPEALARPEGWTATLPNGIAVELLSVARRSWNAPPWLPPVPPDALPVWRSDGSPYLRQPPEGLRRIGIAQEFEDRALDDRGMRYLTFRVSGPPGAEISLGGYVPDSARQGEARPYRHGRQAPAEEELPKGGKAEYEAPILVDDRSERHYRVAVATGPWRKVAVAALDLKNPTGNVVLARGEWGALHQDARVIDEMGKSQGHGGPGPWVEYRVEAPEPRRFATRLRFVDAAGESEIGDRLPGWQPYSGRVEVEVRPYAWAEFSNVHYDPDPALWPASYWGGEGRKAWRGGTAIQALVEASVENGQVFTSRVFAPDGRLWRAYPDAEAVRTGGPATPASRSGLFALVRLDPRKGPERSAVLVQAFASEGGVAGKGLGGTLGAPDEIFGARFPFRRPATPFVQLGVYYPLPWKKVGEIAPPTPKEIDRLVAALSREKSEGQAATALLAIAEASGRADLRPGGGLPPRMGVVRWKPRKPDTRARIVVRLRTGGRRVVEGEIASPLRFYLRHADALFSLDDKGAVRCQGIDLRDVAAFEIETQDYARPMYAVAKLPPP